MVTPRLFALCFFVILPGKPTFCFVNLTIQYFGTGVVSLVKIIATQLLLKK